MNLLDRITLLRAGYSRKEIDQMIAEDAEAAAKAAAEQAEDPEPEQDPEPAEDPEPEKKPEPDYKKLYEAQTEALEKAQAANRQRDNKGKDKDPHEVLKEIVTSFM